MSPTVPDPITAQIVIWAVALGGLVPLLTSVALQPTWPKPARVSASVAASAIAGAVAAVAAGGGHLDLSTPPSIVAAVLLSITTAQATYRGIWKPSGVTDAIEKATSPTPTTAKHAVPEPDTDTPASDGHGTVSPTATN